MKLILSPLAVLLLTSSSSPRVVEVEIVEVPRSGAAHSSKLAVAVVEERGWFTSDGRDVKIGARIDHDGTQNLVLEVRFERRGANDLDIHAAKVVPQATRTLFGRVENDNGVTEVFATIR